MRSLETAKKRLDAIEERLNRIEESQLGEPETRGHWAVPSANIHCVKCGRAFLVAVETDRLLVLCEKCHSKTLQLAHRRFDPYLTEAK